MELLFESRTDLDSLTNLGLHSATVFIDPDSAPSHRYRATGCGYKGLFLSHPETTSRQAAAKDDRRQMTDGSQESSSSSSSSSSSTLLPDFLQKNKILRVCSTEAGYYTAHSADGLNWTLDAPRPRWHSLDSVQGLVERLGAAGGDQVAILHPRPAPGRAALANDPCGFMRTTPF
ncbi:MAG: hypothetical protein FJ290_23705 [Planctomycetes bacterium]|nr:hypothetical protein [Planctomycetota bacterium]